MKDEQYICPHCGEDITEYVHAEIIRHVRRTNAEAMRRKQNKDPEIRKKLNAASAERLKKWREEHPEDVKKGGFRASHARTPETFARQAETVKETQRRKAIKFAELMLSAKEAGRKITPEIEKELLEKSRQIVREELKEERRSAKKSRKSEKER